ncbi:hypothetical protein VFPPC_09200 [Pochonia chlamydosporia 170]|uniref:Uncharacterized protein n=1 Tax=Pochonia chlamydosporia 170 TaxID=1380566 RepID=A0A179FCW8_METCM|nr:hypothetical protein VFPPC_09200 [Pochonia chlamydosporia 170]OAQ63344.1 hypothetical protein VFPPC_09200 [Pochonia chlamydosporia 170]
MGLLASIPKANNSLHSTFDIHHPRSRVVFLSKRPGRSRCSVRKSPFAKHSQFKQPEHSRHDNGSQIKPRREFDNDISPSTSSKPGPSSACTKTSSENSPKTRRQLHKSDSPFDLNSFPEPPSAITIMQPGKCSLRKATNSARRHAAPKPPLALAQRKLLVPNPRRPANARQSLMDAASDLVDPSRRQSVDSVLVAAVSRSIAQQFRLVSKLSSRTSSHNNPSRTSSQQNALNRFTRDLESYAKQTEAKGKASNVAPTPPGDNATLHTVSDLLPYRPQLRAAGLAVTSREQGQGVPHYLKQLQPGLPPPTLHRQRGHGRHQVTQLDGYTGSGPSQSTGTEVSFARSQDMDEFRYALIDEAPVRKKKHRSAKKRPARRCLPCFPAEEDLTTDTDWAHFRAPSARPKVLQKKPPKETREYPRNKALPIQTRAPEPVGSSSHSPHQKSTAQEEGNPHVQEAAYEWDRPNFITTGRRHSMTMPKPQPRNKACYIGHRHRHGAESQERVGNNSMAVSDHAKPLGYNGTIQTRQPGRPPPSVEAPPNVSAKPSQSQRGNQVDTLLTSQTDGQRGRGTGAGATSSRQRPPRSIRNKKQPVSQYDPYHIGICCPKSRGVPAMLTARPNIPRRTSSIQGSTDSIEVDYDDREISDRDVLRGLHIAASAACNEEIDAFVRNKTGLRIRRFLADLMALETLTAVRAGEDDEQHARRRRAEMRKLKQQVRRSREVVMAGGLI